MILYPKIFKLSFFTCAFISHGRDIDFYFPGGMNACGLALSQITYLIASLTKKNNKSSIVELNQVIMDLCFIGEALY